MCIEGTYLICEDYGRIVWIMMSLEKLDDFKTKVLDIKLSAGEVKSNFLCARSVLVNSESIFCW